MKTTKDKWRCTYVVENAGHMWGPFKTPEAAAKWIAESHCWGAPILVVRFPRGRE